MLNTFDNDNAMLLAAVQELTAEQAQIKAIISETKPNCAFLTFSEVTPLSLSSFTGNPSLTAKEIYDMISQGVQVYAVADFRPFNSSQVLYIPIDSFYGVYDDIPNYTEGTHTTYDGKSIDTVYTIQVYSEGKSPFEQNGIISMSIN